MKIVVTEMPKTPRECMFSNQDIRIGGHYICNLRPYIPEAKCSPRCVCKDVKNCDRLITLDDALELRDHDFEDQYESMDLDMKWDEYLNDCKSRGETPMPFSLFQFIQEM